MVEIQSETRPVRVAVAFKEGEPSTPTIRSSKLDLSLSPPPPVTDTTTKEGKGMSTPPRPELRRGSSGHKRTTTIDMNTLVDFLLMAEEGDVSPTSTLLPTPPDCPAANSSRMEIDSEKHETSSSPETAFFPNLPKITRSKSIEERTKNYHETNQTFLVEAERNRRMRKQNILACSPFARFGVAPRKTPNEDLDSWLHSDGMDRTSFSASSTRLDPIQCSDAESQVDSTTTSPSVKSRKTLYDGMALTEVVGNVSPCSSSDDDDEDADQEGKRHRRTPTPRTITRQKEQGLRNRRTPSPLTTRRKEQEGSKMTTSGKDQIDIGGRPELQRNETC